MINEQKELSDTIGTLTAKEKVLISNKAYEHLKYFNNVHTLEDLKIVHQEYANKTKEYFETLNKANTTDFDKVITSMELAYTEVKKQYK